MPQAMKDPKDFTELEDLEYYHSVRACPSIEVTDADAIEIKDWSQVDLSGWVED